MTRRLAPFLLALCFVCSFAAGRPAYAVPPGVCDPFDDNVGATPSTTVDLKYAANDCGFSGVAGFRFHPINFNTAWTYEYCPFDSGTAGSTSWVWLCAQSNLTVTTTTCAHNSSYTTTNVSPGTPGPAWAPCWKQNTTSQFRRLLPGQSGSGFTASTGGGNTSVIVTNGWLPRSPLCPYLAGTPGAVQPAQWTNCNTTSDSGLPEYILQNGNNKVTGLWPSGQTGAPCVGRDVFNANDVVAVYNCPVEPRTHYDY